MQIISKLLVNNVYMSVLKNYFPADEYMVRLLFEGSNRFR